MWSLYHLNTCACVRVCLFSSGCLCGCTRAKWSVAAASLCFFPSVLPSFLSLSTSLSLSLSLSICCCHGNQSYSSSIYPFAESGKGGCCLIGVVLLESLGGISYPSSKQHQASCSSLEISSLIQLSGSNQWSCFERLDFFRGRSLPSQHYSLMSY